MTTARGYLKRMIRSTRQTLLAGAVFASVGWSGPIAAGGVAGDLDALVEELQAGNRSAYEVFPPLPPVREVERSPAGGKVVAPTEGTAGTMQPIVTGAGSEPAASSRPMVRARVFRNGEASGSKALAADLIRRGTEALDAGANERAVRLLREGVKLDPGHVPGYTNLGAALLQAGRPGEAVATLETAVALDPDQAAGWNNLAVAEWRSGSFAAAREHFLRAAALDPGAASALVNLALLQSQHGDREVSLLTLRRALARPNVPPQAHLQLAFALERAGRPTEAASHLEIYLATAALPEPGLGKRLQAHLRELRTAPMESPLAGDRLRSRGIVSDD